MSLIHLNNVTKTYPDGTQALRGVSFTIARGDMVAIMGPSGSGKSTLLHVLGFLDRHTEGEYRFKDKQFDEYSPHELAQVRNFDMGFVFQMFNLLPNITVLQNVILPLYYSAIPESEWVDRATKVLDQVGLSHRLTYQPKKLSGGERQRVAIARALVTDPDVIFADEPTGNLDTKAGAGVMEELQRLNRAGKTVIVITHEPDIARYCQRLIYVVDGRIERDEPVADHIETKV